jgi:cell division protein FtsW
MILLGVVSGLLCLGLLMVYNASSIKAFHLNGDSGFYLGRQLVYACLGGSLLFFAARIDYHWWQRLRFLVLLGGLALLVLVLVPGVGHQVKGATRWIRTPLFNLQASEFAKLSFVVYLAASLERKGEVIRELKRGLFPIFLVFGIFATLLMLEPDFGSCVVLGIMTLVLTFVAGARMQHFLGMLLTALVLVVPAVVTKGYRLQRLTSFLTLTGKGAYQLKQSLIAYGTGGLYGVGAGNSAQKLYYLPEAYTDFIVAVWAEEFGFVGVVVLVALIFGLLFVGLKIARSAPDRFGELLAGGLTLFLVLQMTINFWVTLGLLPTKGLTFPFLSYGGSSLCASLAAVGVLLNVARQTD